VDDQPELFPKKLSRSQHASLSNCAYEAQSLSPNALLKAAEKHLQQTMLAYNQNRLVNIRLASAIYDVICRLANELDSMDKNHAWWLRGAMRYFSTNDDGEPDLQSPLGFEDDAEILNCVQSLIGRDDLRITIEDYDHV
jgi:uncharacterized membrane protein YkvA (DUF1232 family)